MINGLRTLPKLSSDNITLINSHADSIEESLMSFKEFAISHEMLTQFEYGSLDSLAFSHDGKIIFFDKIIPTWYFGDRITNQKIDLNLCFSLDTKFVFSPDSSRLAIIEWRSVVTILDVPSWKKIVSLNKHHDSVQSMSFSADGKMFAFGIAYLGLGHPLPQYVNDAVGTFLYDLPAKNEMGKLNYKSKAITFLADGKILACDNRSLILWDIETKSKIETLVESVLEILAFSFDGRLMIYQKTTAFPESPNIFPEDRLILWDVLEKRKIDILDNHSTISGAIKTVVFSPDTNIIAGGCLNGIVFWNSTSRKIIGFIEKLGIVTKLSFSPDGKFLVSVNRGYRSGDNDEVILWNVEGRCKIGRLIYTDDKGKNRITNRVVAQ